MLSWSTGSSNASIVNTAFTTNVTPPVSLLLLFALMTSSCWVIPNLCYFTLNPSYKQNGKISDGGPVHFHIGISIKHDCLACTIALSQMVFIDCIILQFWLDDAYPIGTPFKPGAYLSKASSPTPPEDHSAMNKTPYREPVGFLMYYTLPLEPTLTSCLQSINYVVSSTVMAAHTERLQNMLYATLKELALFVLSLVANRSFASLVL